MTIEKAITAGLAGEKRSRAITGTSEVSAGRSAVATVSGATIAGVTTSAVVVGAEAVGLTVLATAAAPVVVPVALVAGGIAFIASLF